MSSQKRHDLYYLNYIGKHSENWNLFAAEWIQIQRAWAWIKKEDKKMLMLLYVATFYSFQHRYAFWHAAIPNIKESNRF